MYISRLHIENIKLFDRVEFDLTRPNSSLAGWTVFVGGNSSGKSTLLKAMALALMGPETGIRLMGSTEGWIRKGQSKASVVLTMNWDKDHDVFKERGKLPGNIFKAGVRWTLDKKEDEIPHFRAVDLRNPQQTRIQTAQRGPWSPNSKGWFSSGYGPMRRLSGSSSESMRYSASSEQVSRYVTLFREDAALSESEEWLRRMHARGLESADSEIQIVLDGVKSLLEDGLLPLDMRIARITVDHVIVRDRDGIEIPMRDISDGCRSIYATVLDLVHGLCEVYGATDLFGKNEQGHPIVRRPGVVIVDEIEAHLHPAWQRDIPYWLKSHFPFIQFLVSTHSPLIAQAADPHGLFILPTQNDSTSEPRRASDKEYDRIRWGTAQKTVLGVAFGLHSTRTRWAQKRIQRWQELEAQKRAGVPLTAEEGQEYTDLHDQLTSALDEPLAIPG